MHTSTIAVCRVTELQCCCLRTSSDPNYVPIVHLHTENSDTPCTESSIVYPSSRWCMKHQIVPFGIAQFEAFLLNLQPYDQKRPNDRTLNTQNIHQEATSTFQSIQ